jgi:hypothetical protein
MAEVSIFKIQFGSSSGSAVQIKRHAKETIVTPHHQTAAADVFAVDFKMERERDRSVAVENQPGAASRNVQHEASDACVLEEINPSFSTTLRGPSAW